INLLDGAFTFFLTATVLAFTLAQTSPPRSPAERRWMLTAWAAAALAVLSKGIVVGVLAGAALVIYTLIERDSLTWRRLHLAAGLPLFAGVAAPWFVVVSLRNPAFPGFFFVHEHFARFLTTVHQRVEPWWYFLPLLLVGVLPWVVPLARACGRAALTSGAAAGAAPGCASAPFEPLKFLLVFAAVTLLLYRARRNSYVPHEALLWTGAALLTALAAVVITWRARPATRTAASVATALAAILGWQCLMCAYSATPPARSARQLVRAARPYIRAATPLYSVGQYRETVSPYLARTLQLVDYEGELHFGLEQEPQQR